MPPASSTDSFTSLVRIATLLDAVEILSITFFFRRLARVDREHEQGGEVRPCEEPVELRLPHAREEISTGSRCLRRKDLRHGRRGRMGQV